MCFLCVDTKNNKSSKNKNSTGATNVTASDKSSSVPVTRDSGKGGKKPKPTNDGQVHCDDNHNNPNSQVVSTTLSVKPNTNYSVALATTTMQVRSDCGKPIEARAFFDWGQSKVLHAFRPSQPVAT